MAYYIIYNNTDIYTAENANTLTTYYPECELHTLPDDYNQDKYHVVNGELVLNPNYDEEQADIREANFKAQFFEIPNYGWYRKVPKGYSSAVESLNTAFNAVSIMGSLPANMLIFYQEPDYSIPEQCTEEWLVEHQIFNQAMTAQEFGQFYITFMTAWNTQEHEV